MLEGMTPPIKERLCGVGIKMSELDAKDLQILTDALDDPRWIAETLSEELDKRGVSLGAKIIRLHRKKSCACAR